jgi:hypothetical protein
MEWEKFIFTTVFVEGRRAGRVYGRSLFPSVIGGMWLVGKEGELASEASTSYFFPPVHIPAAYSRLVLQTLNYNALVFLSPLLSLCSSVRCVTSIVGFHIIGGLKAQQEFCNSNKKKTPWS